MSTASFRERYKPPYVVELTTGGHYVVKDASGRSLAWVYIERDQTKTQPSGLAPEEGLALANAIAGLGNQGLK